ncbi:MAG TPA: type II toxin-antitoxin system Phd/YefM family antitoxin [Polyangiaceae bacterium]|nr:type II toxin-antitoxin system Phd/YefM family antitoxin [Polyangiaceae bacterium]
MKTLPVSEFKAGALGIIRKVHATGEAVLVTNHGKPLVRVEPVRSDTISGYGCMVETCEVVATEDDLVRFGSGDWETVASWDEAQRRTKRRK